MKPMGIIKWLVLLIVAAIVGIIMGVLRAANDLSKK